MNKKDITIAIYVTLNGEIWEGIQCGKQKVKFFDLENLKIKCGNNWLRGAIMFLLDDGDFYQSKISSLDVNIITRSFGETRIKTKSYIGNEKFLADLFMDADECLWRDWRD